MPTMTDPAYTDLDDERRLSDRDTLLTAAQAAGARYAGAAVEEIALDVRDLYPDADVLICDTLTTPGITVTAIHGPDGTPLATAADGLDPEWPDVAPKISSLLQLAIRHAGDDYFAEPDDGEPGDVLVYLPSLPLRAR